MQVSEIKYELLDKDGNSVSIHHTALDAAKKAELLWPEQAQDWERSGNGWDVQVAE